MGGEYSKPEVHTKYLPQVVEHIPMQQGRVHVITGSTSGTGFVFAKTLGQKSATVVSLNRKSERSEKAGKQLREEVPEGKFVDIECDLKSFDSVRKAAQQVKEQFPDGIDSLVLNAGIMAVPEEDCEGYDVQMHVNHLSHFLLTKELFSLLEKAAERHGEARVVAQTSISRLYPSQDLDPKYLEKNGGDLGGDGSGIAMNGPRWVKYHETKLANAAFIFALADKLEHKGSKVKACLAHPGLAVSGLHVRTVETGGLGNAMTSMMMKLAQSAEDGAQGIIKAAAGAAEEVANASFFGPGSTSMALYGPVKSLPRKKEKMADNDKAKDIVWKCSEKAVGVFAI